MTCRATRATRCMADSTTARRKCAPRAVSRITVTGQKVPRGTSLAYPVQLLTCLNRAETVFWRNQRNAAQNPRRCESRKRRPQMFGAGHGFGMGSKEGRLVAVPAEVLKEVL